MDQDIHFQKRIDFDASSAMTTYMAVPYRCTMRNLTGIVQADPGDSETVTVTYGTAAASCSTAIGVLTFGSSIAAGAVGTWAADASTGDTVMASGGFLKFVTTAGAAAQCDLDVELDPYCR